MPDESATGRLAAAIEQRAGSAAQVLARALEIARPVLKPQSWQAVNLRSGDEAAHQKLRALERDWSSQRAITLCEAQTLAEPDARPRTAHLPGIAHRLLWLEDGRLAEVWALETWRRAEPKPVLLGASALRASLITCREAINAFALPAILLRLSSNLASGAEALRQPAELASQSVERLLADTSAQLAALVKQSRGECPPGALDPLLEKIALALEDGAEALREASEG